MKEKYRIYHYGDLGMYIIVSNYKFNNDISNYYFETENKAIENKDKFDVGIWKIKQLKKIKPCGRQY